MLSRLHLLVASLFATTCGSIVQGGHDHDTTIKICSCFFPEKNCDCFCHGPLEDNIITPLPSNLSCPNFSFELEGGTYDFIPPHFFTVIGTVDTFFFDSVNVNFKNYLPSAIHLSPFLGVSFRHEAFLVFLKVRVEERWNWGSLSQMKPISGAKAAIQIFLSHVPELTSDFSQICSGAVTSVRVTKSSVKKLEDRVFYGFENLTDVSLAKNLIEEVKRTHFPRPALQLERIILSKNKLTVLPEYLFSDMPALKVVDLSGNSITILDENTFAPYFNRIEFLGLVDFSLTCDCTLRWVKEFNNSEGKNPLDEGTCSKPRWLNGRKFSEVDEKDLKC